MTTNLEPFGNIYCIVSSGNAAMPLQLVMWKILFQLDVEITFDRKSEMKNVLRGDANTARWL